MLRRPTARAAALALAPLLALAALPSTGLAVGIQSTTVYRIINSTDKPLDYVVLGFTPTGAIVPPDDAGQQSPLTIGAHSPGLDPNQVRVGIVPFTVKGGPVQNALGIDFQGNILFPTPADPGKPTPATPPDNGLGVGQFVDFTLNLRSLSDQLQFSFIAPPASSGIQFQVIGAPATPGSGDGTGSGSGSDVAIPEPLSLAIWASLTALGLLRAHAFRRSHRPAPAA